jgi:uncharacterized Zn-binding protein involved in type VI secretion
MGPPAAKQGDQITATDTHLVVTPDSTVPKPMTFPFAGPLSGGLSNDVKIMGKPAAVKGSTADNTPPHQLQPPASFATPPSNKGTIKSGSQTVTINGKSAARHGDPAETCNDPVDVAVGTVKAEGTVMIG